MAPSACGSSGRAGSLILAPHSDDAAFSLGGAIIGRHLPAPITVVTLFGRTNYARGQFHADVDSVTEMRRAEDEQWTISAGVRLVHLDYPEISLRTASTFEAIFGPPDLSDPVLSDLTKILATYIARERPSLLLAPAGIGSHCDHVLTREMARKLAAGADMAIAIYEDLPYAHDAGRHEIAKTMSGILRCPYPLVLPLGPGVLDAKCASLSFYPSQIEDAVLQAVRQHGLAFGHRDGAECVWLSAADRGRVGSFA